MYRFIKEEASFYTKTKYTNIGIGMSKTKIIAIYDCDVLIPVNQIIEAVENIRNKKSALSYPFDGRFVFMERKVTEILKTSLSCIQIKKLEFAVTVHENSYGGCCFLNKRIYKKCELDNEKFDTWGREDIERGKAYGSLWV